MEDIHANNSCLVWMS